MHFSESLDEQRRLILNSQIY